MTLIINMSSPSFSVLAADLRAKINGTGENITMKIGDMTINTTGNVNLTGYNKLTRSKDNKSIVGIAGDAQKHKYIEDIKEAQDIKEIISIIKNYVHTNTNITGSMKNNKIQYEVNEGIYSFFNSDNSKFYTLIYEVSEIHNGIRLFENNNKLIFYFKGSGSKENNELITGKKVKEIKNQN